MFSKAPVGGAVKTRLADGVGMAAATAWYRRALDRTARTLRCAGIGHVMACAPSAAVFRSVSGWPARLCGQAMGDLGRRMGLAAKLAGGPSVIVGVDIPHLSPAILRAARDAVRRYDMVLGPARDGGFYLIGLKTPAHAFRLYDRVRWSSEHAMADVLATAPGHWWIGRLPELSDVDVAADMSGERADGAYNAFHFSMAHARTLR